jgi:hypothetical protein
MIIGTLAKQPAEVLRVTVDYASRFLTGTETITSMTATTSPTTTTPLTALVLSAFPLTTAVISVGGGDSGESYLVTLRATTSFGQVLESEIAVACEEISL